MIKIKISRNKKEKEGDWEGMGKICRHVRFKKQSFKNNRL